jgi:hypothetical protein
MNIEKSQRKRSHIFMAPHLKEAAISAVSKYVAESAVTRTYMDEDLQKPNWKSWFRTTENQ